MCTQWGNFFRQTFSQEKLCVWLEEGLGTSWWNGWDGPIWVLRPRLQRRAHSSRDQGRHFVFFLLSMKMERKKKTEITGQEEARMNWEVCESHHVFILMPTMLTNAVSIILYKSFLISHLKSPGKSTLLTHGLCKWIFSVKVWVSLFGSNWFSLETVYTEQKARWSDRPWEVSFYYLQKTEMENFIFPYIMKLTGFWLNYYRSLRVQKVPAGIRITHEINVILKKTRNICFYNFYLEVQKIFIFFSCECQNCLIINLHFGFIFLIIKVETDMVKG